jgi:hypothetical protein
LGEKENRRFPHVGRSDNNEAEKVQSFGELLGG